MLRGYRYRLYPTDEQAAHMRQIFGVCRLVCNLGLECREKFWREHKRNTGKHISFFSQCQELTQLRKEFDWIRAVPRLPQEAALRDLDNSFQRFFSGLGRYPRPRRKFVDDRFSVRGDEVRSRPINARWAEMYVSRVGWVRYRRTRDCGEVKSATVSCLAGRWHISALGDREVETRAAARGGVGIDRGIANTIALSTGDRLSVPAAMVAIERRQRSARRALSRKHRGSARHAKQRQRVAAISARVARMRKDWHHRATTQIARTFSFAVIEDLDVGAMTAAGPSKRGLNRSILNQGWGIFRSYLAYKLEQRGGTLVTVPAAYTSQTCSACGTIDRESRESQASFHCQHCGSAMHADHNAAINILRLGSTQSLRVEEAGYGSDEARTRSGRKLVENHLALAG